MVWGIGLRLAGIIILGAKLWAVTLFDRNLIRIFQSVGAMELPEKFLTVDGSLQNIRKACSSQSLDWLWLGSNLGAAWLML